VILEDSSKSILYFFSIFTNYKLNNKLQIIKKQKIKPQALSKVVQA